MTYQPNLDVHSRSIRRWAVIATGLFLLGWWLGWVNDRVATQSPVQAQEKSFGSLLLTPVPTPTPFPESDRVGETILLDQSSDYRVDSLSRFLKDQRSPMIESALTFVGAADEYGLDWRWLPAIAGKESNFGKVIPWNSYNPFGWGIHSGRVMHFKNWDQAILRVAQGLQKNYFSRGADTLEEIEPIYAPPSVINGHSWLKGVSYFIQRLEEF